MRLDKPRKLVKYEISCCQQCPHEVPHLLESACGNKDCRESNPVIKRPWGRIPDWCPLEDPGPPNALCGNCFYYSNATGLGRCGWDPDNGTVDFSAPACEHYTTPEDYDG